MSIDLRRVNTYCNGSACVIIDFSADHHIWVLVAWWCSQPTKTQTTVWTSEQV